MKQPKIAIVGGGIAGATAAIYLGGLGLDITLFEQENSLVNGPPWCHLHAGGNFYPEISDEQCLTLLKQSIDFARFYPHILDYRPTVIALPLGYPRTPETFLPRLQKLQKEYQMLIEADEANEVLGKSSSYYRLFERSEVEALRSKEISQNPISLEEWLIPVAKYVDLDTIQFPLILVQEYGLNLFRAGASLSLGLKTLPNVSVNLSTKITRIQPLEAQWKLTSEHGGMSHASTFDYLINAAGFRTGKLDDMLGIPCKRMVEFKAAYVSRWDAMKEVQWPEMVFHGKRGTPKGMGQFTPYPHGYFQLHGMTKEITLYEDGLVGNSTVSCQPDLHPSFIEKIEKEWSETETKERTQSAIKHLARFIPSFATAKVGSKPLFGAQQIPGDDPDLRVAEVDFPVARYARCEIVKVSSVLDMIDAIVQELIGLGYLSSSAYGKRDLNAFNNLSESDINKTAEVLCELRNYPIDLGHRNFFR